MRGDVPAVHEHAARVCHAPLLLDHLLAHGPQARHLRYDGADRRCADFVRNLFTVDEDLRPLPIIAQTDRDVGDGCENLLIRQRLSCLECLPRDGAVHRARVDVSVAEFLRSELSDRALARARRPVDRHHEFLCHHLSPYCTSPSNV